MVITRSDITSGYQVVQSAHSVADFAVNHSEIFLKWKEESNYIICLQAKNLQHLLFLYSQFKEQTECSIFYEPDIGQYTSICLYGTEDIRNKLSNLPLSLKEKNLQTS